MKDERMEGWLKLRRAKEREGWSSKGRGRRDMKGDGREGAEGRNGWWEVEMNREA